MSDITEILTDASCVEVTKVTSTVEIVDEQVYIITVGAQGPTGPAGLPGPQGTGGISAYEVAVANGFVGDEAAWLASLVGAQGEIGPQGPAGVDGIIGHDGLSAYEIALENGFVGDEAAWLASLVGVDGADGPQGPKGDAADIALETHSATDKVTPVDADELPLIDSAATFSLKKLTWSNLKSTLKTYLDTLYAAVGHAHTGTYEPADSNIQSHLSNTSNPHSVTYSQVGAAPTNHSHAYVPTTTSVDNQIARFDGVGGAIQGGTYEPTISDEGNLLVNPTWNAAGTTFTALKVNATDTASASGSLLADFQVGGVSKASLSKQGAVVITPTSDSGVLGLKVNASSTINGYNAQYVQVNQYATLASILLTNQADNYAYAVRSASDSWGRLAFGLDSGSPFLSFGSGSTAKDVALVRDSAGILAQRNSTNAQTYRIYNTYTDVSNYERATFSWGSNLLTIGTEAAGTGTARDLEFNVGGSRLRLTSIGASGGSIFYESSTAIAGNARGASSLDLQMWRNSALKVASATASTICGGVDHLVSGTYSVIIGGELNTITSSTYSGIVGGKQNTLSAANLSYGTIIGGFGNSISDWGHYSIVGGLQCSNSGSPYSITFGRYARATATSSLTLGAGTALGTCQIGIQPIGIKTTDATSTIMTVIAWDGTRWPNGLLSSKAYGFSGIITAYSDSTDGFKAASWEIKGLIKRDASNNTTMVGTPNIDLIAMDTDALNGGWDVVSVTANDTNESFDITVKGEAGTTIQWTASIMTAQAGH